MKIALLIQRFPGGGAESYVEEIASRLYKKGEDVTIITSENKYADDSKYDFRIIRLPSMIKIGEYSIWRGLEKVLKQHKFDIVHLNTYGYYHSDKAARLKEKLGYKLVITSHGFTGMDLHNLKKEKVIAQNSSLDFLRKLYDNRVGKKTLLLCDHLIALSQYDYDFYKKIGIDESKISILPPGVNDIFFDVKKNQPINLKGDPILLSVGQLSWIKNQRMIIQAIPSLLKIKPNLHLYLIGPDGGESANLVDLTKRLSVENHVTFLGSKSLSEINSYMKSAHLLLHTSFAEGLSTVLLESIVSELPFITTPAGGNEVLARESNMGIVVDFNDIQSLSNKIITLLDSVKLKSMTKNRLYSKNFLWDVIFSKLVQIYYALNNQQIDSNHS